MPTVKDRIQALLPGEENKARRAKAYSTPGIMTKGADPSDADILAAAGAGDEEAQTEVEPPSPSLSEGYPEVANLLAQVPKVQVHTATDYQEAAKWFSALKEMSKAVEERRKELVRKPLEEQRAINAEAKAAQDVLALALAPVEQAMVAFKIHERDELRRQEEERQAALKAEQDRLQAEAEAAKAKLAQVEDDPFLAGLFEEEVQTAREAVTNNVMALAIGPDVSALPEPAKPVTAAGTSTRVRWIWKVWNEDLVPRELCSPDPVKIRARVKELEAQHKGNIGEVYPDEIPGVRMEEEVSVKGGR